MAEGGGLLNRYRVVKPYRGFESLRLRKVREIFRRGPRLGAVVGSRGFGGQAPRRTCSRKTSIIKCSSFIFG